MFANRPTHRRQRGQVVPIVAIAATVLFGAAALAVDLSLQTHDQRTLQNVSDVAALAGAQDLPSSPTAADQYQGAQDAFQLIRKRMGWQSISVGGSTVANSAWAQTLASPCSPTFNTGTPPACDVTKTVCSNVTPAPADLPATCDSYAALSANAHYFSITIQSPAKTSNIASHTDPHYFEVTIAQDTQNYIAGVLGRGTSTQGSRSTAYHFPPNQSFGFALFAKSVIAAQNQATWVLGDVYADRNIDPQSQGQAGFCATGSVVLGAPQNGVPAGQTPPDGQAQLKHKNAYPIQTDSSLCSPTANNTSAGFVYQGRTPSAGVCAGFSAVYDTDPNINTCVANPSLISPTLPAPTLPDRDSTYGCVTATSTSKANPGYFNCTSGTALTIASDNALNPGVYFITHNPNCNPKSCYDVNISVNTALSGVTFWLDQGATLGVVGNSTTVSINPAPATVQKSPGDGRYPIYAPPGSVAQVFVASPFANLTLYGTMYLPDGVAASQSNGYFNITGQAIVGTWDDQGGNHTTSQITYDASRNAPQAEVLKLVE